MKRRNKNGDGDGDGGEWSKDQDARLHRAHLLVRATPNFWRDIANLVPGKSAEECFHRFYSAHPTPPVAPHGRRVDCLSSPIRPLEVTKNKEKEKKKKKPLSPTRLLHGVQAGKVKSRKARIEPHRAVREMLRKQQIDNQGYEEDAFAALEKSDVPSWDKAADLVGIATPASKKKKKVAKKNKKEVAAMAGSSSSRFSEVLKMPTSSDGKKHEKYLDLLIRRNRIPAAPRRRAKKEDPTSSGGGGGDGGGFGSKLKERLGSSRNLATARSAVIAGARDVLEQMHGRSSEEEQLDYESEISFDDCDDL